MNKSKEYTDSDFPGRNRLNHARSISRRDFIGGTAVALGVASAGLLGAGGLKAEAANAPASGSSEKDIRVGMMTAPVSDMPLEHALDMAKRCGQVALEVMAGPGSKLLDTANFSQADAD